MQDIKRQGMCDYGKMALSSEELVDIATTPPGVEWLVKGITTLEEIEQVTAELKDPKEWGCYVHQGSVAVDSFAAQHTPQGGYQACVLVGETEGEVRLSGPILTYVVLLHGASVRVVASDYAVFKVYGEGNRSIEKDDTVIEL